MYHMYYMYKLHHLLQAAYQEYAWSTLVMGTCILLGATIVKVIYPPLEKPVCGYRCVNMFYPAMTWFITVGMHQWLVVQKIDAWMIPIYAIGIAAYGRTMRYMVRLFFEDTSYEPSGHISIQIMVAVLCDLTIEDLPSSLRLGAYVIVLTGNWWTVYQFHTVKEAWVGWVMGLIYSVPLVALFMSLRD